MKLYLLNYADDRFKHKGGKFLENQARLNKSAQKQGIDHIISWKWPELAATSFYAENEEYLNKNRFENGAVWKPFIVQQLLQEIEYGDIIFYYDCGAYTINRPVNILTNLCIRNGGTLFHEWGEKNFKYTKRDAFVYMDCDSPRYHNAVALQNTWFLLQKNNFTVKFTHEWLKYNLDERIASYVKSNTCGLPDILGFVENRGDQSIFTNLATKYRVHTFRGAGGSQNRQVDNFVDSLSWRSQARSFVLTTKLQTKFWLKAAAYQIRSSSKPVKFTIQDCSFRLYPYGGSVRELWFGEHSKRILIDSVMSLADQSSTIVEVGANVGVITVPLSKQLTQGKIYAIEADPELCQHLKNNLELNDCLDRVTVVPTSISDKPGQKTLQVNDLWRDPFNTIGKPIDENCRVVALKQVPSMSLTQVLETYHISKPDMLVLDVSGGELPILKGATSILSGDYSPLVIYRCLHRACLGFGYQPQEIQTFMRAQGYRLFRLGWNPQLIELSTNEKHQGFVISVKEADFHKLRNLNCKYLSD